MSDKWDDMPEQETTEPTTALATTKHRAAPVATHNIMQMILDEMGPLAFCRHLADSGLYQKGPQALAKIVSIIATGAEVGMPPMWSLKNIQFVGDKHSFTASGVGDLVMRSGYMMYHVTEKTPERCELRWTRDGDDVGTSYFDLAKARVAGLSGNVWKKYPESMLFARALTDGGRTYCPEIFGGTPYTAEELTRSEVVDVQQGPRRETPHRPVQAPHQETRSKWRASLIGLVDSHCGDNKACKVRLWKAIGKEVGKPGKDMDADDFEATCGKVQGYADEKCLDQWVDTMLQDIQDAEVVDETHEPGSVDEERTAANRAYHAVLSPFLAANGFDKRGEEYAILKDHARMMADLAPAAPWSEMPAARMLKSAKELESMGGKLALAGLDVNGDWRADALKRGAIQ